MKSFAKRLLAAASAAAIALTTIPAVCGADLFSEPEVAVAEEIGPTMLRSVTAASPLSRQNLSTLVMNGYETLTGLNDQVFTDCDSTDELQAHHLELALGVTVGIFAPDGSVSRQALWVAATKLLETAGYPYINDITMDLSIYADSSLVSGYADQSLQALLCIGAVTAEEGEALDPCGTVTIGEAEELLGRIVEFFTAWQEDPVKPQRCLGEEVAEFALNFVGCRYVRGGHGPNKFDCSGFVYYVYKNFGYDLKPGARNQWSLLDGTIKKADLLPGDLVFFSNSGHSSGIFHVGIYIGDGEFVHAANSRKGLIVTDMDDNWYSRRYLGAKRAIQ